VRIPGLRCGLPVAIIAAAVVLTIAPAAVATPMNSATQPPVIEAAGVSASGMWKEDPEDFKVKLAFGLICTAGKPVPISVVFTVGGANREPIEEVTRRLQAPCGSWASSPTVSPPGTGFEVETFPGYPPIEASEAGSPAEVQLSPQWEVSPGEYPFLYQVVGPSGVIAQAPHTATVQPERRVEQGSPEFQADCVEQGRVRYAAGGGAYCILAASVKYYKGWPAPTLAPQPTASTTVILCANSKETARVPRVKPTRCNTLGPHQALAEDANLADLRWKGWGQPEATGTGIELGAHLPLAHIPVRVRAYGRQQCSDGTGRYTRLRVHDRYGTRVVDFPECPAQ